MFLMKYSRHNDITSDIICAVIDCHVCRSLYGSDIRSPAYLNKTRGIDCVLWCEIAP